VVVGFGVVSVPSTLQRGRAVSAETNAPAAQVTKAQAIGLILSDQPGIKVGVGYSSSTVVQIATNQNILIEVSDRPGQPLKVKSQ
jgi:hypothetical protein